MSKSAKRSKHQREELDNEVADTLGDLVKLSFECQWRRYESMLDTSNRMIAGLSLVFVALATSLQVLMGIEELSRCLAVELVVVFVLLAVSFLLAVVAQYRFSYRGIAAPTAIVEDMEKERGDFKDKFDSRVYICDTVQEPYESFSNLNNKIGKLLRASDVILAIAVGLIILFIVADSVVYLAVAV